MDPIDLVLEHYESDLKKASEGQCKKISRCTEFRDSFQKEYRQRYQMRLEQTQEKLLKRGHSADVKEKSAQEMFYGFSLSVIPRHLLTPPVDRFHPSSLRSSISFMANEHTLSVDVETIINPNVVAKENVAVEMIPRQQFNEDLMLEKILEFLERVFDETIILDFRTP